MSKVTLFLLVFIGTLSGRLSAVEVHSEGALAQEVNQTEIVVEDDLSINAFEATMLGYGCSCNDRGTGTQCGINQCSSTDKPFCGVVNSLGGCVCYCNRP